jgi:hypothetical protein
VAVPLKDSPSKVSQASNNTNHCWSKKGPCGIDVQSKNFPESHIDWFRLRNLPGLEHRQHTQRSIGEELWPCGLTFKVRNSRGLELHLTFIGQEPILYSVSQEVCSEQLLAKKVALHYSSCMLAPARFPPDLEQHHKTISFLPFQSPFLYFISRVTEPTSPPMT